MKKNLSVSQAVHAACILYELNSEPDSVLRLAQRAGLPCAGAEERKKLLWEWRAFTHAAVLYALMVHAPNVVVVEYTRVTQDMLHHLGYDEREAEAFVDGAFRAYVEPLARDAASECPSLFFQRLLGKALKELPDDMVAVISGTMAMILAAVLDKLEEYAFSTEG